MITFQVARTIARPRAEVFERLAAVGAYGSWLPRSIIFRGGWFATPDSNPGNGVAYDEKTPLGTFSGRIVEFEPPAREPPTIRSAGMSNVATWRTRG